MEAEERKAEILLVARRMFLQHGYDATSVARIIEQAGIAKGTFYHHFASKADLVTGLVELGVAELVPRYDSLMERKDLSPVEKLQACFDVSAAWKKSNLELVAATLKAFYRDGNLILRKKMYERNIDVFAPYFNRVIREGVDSGVFSTPFPDRIGGFLLLTMMSLGESWSGFLQESVQNPSRLEEYAKQFDLVEHCINRMLGLPENTIRMGADNLISEIRTYLEKEQTRP
jgi:AcrR family transcriptional regulator